MENWQDYPSREGDPEVKQIFLHYFFGIATAVYHLTLADLILISMRIYLAKTGVLSLANQQ